jgi:hypothetical protein
MPLELYNEIKRRQRAILDARKNSRQALQNDLTEAAGAELGDEAGEEMADGIIKVESMKRERIALGDEAGAED